MTKEQMIMEGADRLEALGLGKDIILKHRTAGTVYVSNWGKFLCAYACSR